MAGLINELMDKLNEMSAHIAALTDYAHQKKEVIIKNDTDALKDITSRENTLVGKYQKAEKAVAVLIKDIAMVLNENPKTLTLGRLGEIIREQDDYGTYMEIYGRLKENLVLLKERNEMNNILIENALEYIDYTVNVLRSTYGGGNDDVTLDTKN